MSSGSLDSSENEVRTKLKSELALVSWNTLEPHLERGAVFWIHPTVDVIDVGVAIALDQLEKVKRHLEAKTLLKAEQHPPSFEHEEDPVGYRVLIVQPYVIASPVYLPETLLEA